ncbi:class I SAM-dependent methyltransferase [Falsiroseomonas sp. E2-1-a4]|uniref:class I SAM-dependent methyltransferase n=1 Tax=Falsiroseomonas sp. E2-1-a4 TaxID=3239299 RepID=UPI003F2AB790
MRPCDLAAESWSLPDGRLVRPADIGVSDDFRLRFGPWKIALDRHEDNFVLDRTGGMLRQLRVVHSGWRAETARLFRPLIYLCAFGEEDQFNQLAVALRSIATFGEYSGHVLLISDRPKAALRSLIPLELIPRMLFVSRNTGAQSAQRMAMLSARYDLSDLPIEPFQPVLYLDTDILCDAPIMPLLEAMNARGGFHVALEGGQAQDVLADRPVTDMAETSSVWFGRPLLEKHPPFDRPLLAINSGCFGFPSKAAAMPVFRQLCAVMSGYPASEADFNPRLGDQPFLSYLLQKQSLGDYRTLTPHVRHLGRETPRADTQRRGLLHFNRGVGEGSKLAAMHDHMAALETRLGAAAPAEPAIRIDRTIPGQMTDAELGRLITLARAVPPNGVIVEVGSLYGLSSWHLAQHCAPSVTVYCIDPWERTGWIVRLVEKPFAAPEFGPDAFRAFTADCPNILMMQGYSPQIAQDWSRPVDLYVEDAVHTNPLLSRNIKFWSDHVRPGGVVAGHDYSQQWPDVMTEAEALAKRYGMPLDVSETLWSVQKPS